MDKNIKAKIKDILSNLDHLKAHKGLKYKEIFNRIESLVKDQLVGLVNCCWQELIVLIEANFVSKIKIFDSHIFSFLFNTSNLVSTIYCIELHSFTIVKTNRLKKAINLFFSIDFTWLKSKCGNDEEITELKGILSIDLP